MEGFTSKRPKIFVRFFPLSFLWTWKHQMEMFLERSRNTLPHVFAVRSSCFEVQLSLKAFEQQATTHQMSRNDLLLVDTNCIYFLIVKIYFWAVQYHLWVYISIYIFKKSLVLFKKKRIKKYNAIMSVIPCVTRVAHRDGLFPAGQTTTDRDLSFISHLLSQATVCNVLHYKCRLQASVDYFVDFL